MRPALALLLPMLLAAQPAALHIRPVGIGPPQPAGARTAGLSVEIADELGKPVPGAVVSFRLPDEGPGGAFASGLSSDIVITGADGKATTLPIRWNRLAGPLQIRITAAKNGVRAGTLISLTLAERERSAPASGSGVPRKWLMLGLAAAGIAGAGFAATRGAPGQAGAAPLQIGPPTITIGNP